MSVLGDAWDWTTDTISSGFDSVSGLFSDVGKAANEGTKAMLSASETAQDVLKNAQDVRSAFSSETLTEKQANAEAKSLSSIVAQNQKALMIGGAVLLGFALVMMFRRR